MTLGPWWQSGRTVLVNDYSHEELTSGYSNKCMDCPVVAVIIGLVCLWGKSVAKPGVTRL